MKKFTWDLDINTTETTSHNVSIIKFGDGYEQRVKTSINSKVKYWKCSKTDYKHVIDEIKGFLDSTGAVEAFTFTPIEGEQSYKARLDGEIARKHIGGNVYSLEFALVQVF